MDPKFFDACAEDALFNTPAVEGNSAGSAMSVGTEDNGDQFVDLNGTRLTLPNGASAVIASGPYGKEAAGNFTDCVGRMHHHLRQVL